MKQILTSLLMAIAMIFTGTTTAKADVSNDEAGQYVLKCGNVSMTIDASKGGKILSYKYGDQEVKHLLDQSSERVVLASCA